MQHAKNLIPTVGVAELGCWKRQSKPEARSVHNDSYFLPPIFTAATGWIFRLEGLGVLEEPGTQLLPLDMLLSCRAALWLSALTAPAHRGRAFLKNRHDSLVFVHRLTLCPLLPAELVKLNSQSHANNSSPSPVKGRSPWWQQHLETPGEVLKTLQMLQHKKLETQLITEIAVWLNILFLHIHCKITFPCLKLFNQVFP